ncbi:hypothetical protein CDN99_00920 [Roseateles aquatilis]|uniref:VIT domain-containing protein n=1 Tax=Roseateles aquatilis TaxID=431061 RepID=A0A246JKG8_9BURK|nr:VIT domain-containing protein [Roseateles aquatilis]OWQ93097.1 hypothetical protein CDN99_00920 [Roseateles aquatilis]
MLRFSSRRRAAAWRGVTTALAALLLSGGAAALSPVMVPPPPPRPDLKSPPPPPPVRWIAFRSAEARTPIRIEQVAVQSRISGSSVVSRVELKVFNPNGQMLSGDLQFPLGDGQTVTGFSLDINGHLRRAVPVEKAKGRQVYEDTVRQRVDPALLEVTEGNVYKLQVYPLPPGGSRRVVLEIRESLAATAESAAPVWRLPLQFSGAVDRMTVDVLVDGLAPSLLTADWGAQPVAITPTADGGSRLRLQREAAETVGELRVTLPARLATPAVTTERFKGKTYVLAEVPVDVAAWPRKAPRTVGLVWDASASGATRDHDREFALLEDWFRTLGDVEVRLKVVRHEAEAVERFTVRGGAWRELRQRLERLPYDGATALGAMDSPKGSDVTLLFSDGIGTWGTGALPTTGGPLFAFSASAGAADTALRRAAETRGGAYADLLSTGTADVLRLLAEEQPRVLDVTGLGAGDWELGSLHPVGGRVLVAGVMTQAQARMTLVLSTTHGTPRVVDVPLRVPAPEAAADASAASAAASTVASASASASGSGSGSGSAAASTSTSTSVPTSAGDAAAPIGLAAHRWASFRLARLDADRSAQRQAVRRLGMEFGLATRETSLIVLDTVRDYVRHDIEPPAELRGEWERLRRALGASLQQERGAAQAEVLRRFEQKLEWWSVTPHMREATQRALNALEAEHQRQQDTSGFTPPPVVAYRPTPSAPSTTAASPVEPPMPAPVPPPVHSPAPAMPMPAPSPMVAPAPAPMAPAAPRPGNSPVTATAVGIALRGVQPDEPYALRLKAASDADLYAIYLDERPAYLRSPGFFLDVADRLIERKQTALAIRVLSNLAEMDLGNRQLLRILAYRLQQAGDVRDALPVLEEVLRLAPDEPQSYRDLGLALAQAGQPQRAVDMLAEVVNRPWQNRFPEVELIALADLSAIAERSRLKGKALDLSAIDARLRRPLPLALRVVLTWDADNTDIDLWVTDPDGERAYFAHPLTRQGGRMSRDFTGGYGPEEFSLRVAKPGTYTVQANFFGHQRQVIAPSTTLMVRLSSGFGTAAQKDRDIVLRLAGRGDGVVVGTFTVK